MIEVQAGEQACTGASFAAAIARLQDELGAYVGSDIALDGLYQREGCVFLDCVLRIEVRGSTIRVDPLNAVGAKILARHGRAFGLEATSRELIGARGVRPLVAPPIVTTSAPTHAAIDWLRRFIGAFRGGGDVFALAAAFAYDYFRLAQPELPAADGELRAVLFVPGSIWTQRAEGTYTFARFVFDGLAAHDAPRLAFSQQPVILAPGDDFPAGHYAPAVARAVEHLQRGDCASLTMSQSFRRSTNVSFAQAFATLRETSPMPAMYAFQLAPGDWLFGASPDIQARIRGNVLECLPVCGTVARGDTPATDDTNYAELLHSKLDAASLALEVEGFRADMEKVCRAGSIFVTEPRRVHRFARLIHGVSRLEGLLQPQRDALDVLLATAAPSMLVGLPREQAIALLPTLEASPRGFYTGVAARIAPTGALDAHSILRGVRLAGGVAEVRTGGTLLAASNPAREEEESRVKARALLAAIGATL